eukprot:143638-Rhodomonas_salina.1
MHAMYLGSFRPLELLPFAFPGFGWLVFEPGAEGVTQSQCGVSGSLKRASAMLRSDAQNESARVGKMGKDWERVGKGGDDWGRVGKSGKSGDE